MTESVNHGLLYENLLASGTMLTFSKTSVLTVGSNSRVDYLCVTEGTKAEVRIVDKILICLCIHTGNEASVTLTTGDGDVAVLGTGRTGNLKVAESVACCRNGLLCYENFVAYRTVRALGKTGFGTGGSLRRVGYCGMTGSRYYGILIAVTADTGMKSVTVNGTGRRNHGIGVSVCTYGVNAVATDRVIAAYQLVGIILTVVRMICRVEVLEATAGYVNYAENSRCFVNVEKESHTVVKRLSLVVSAVDVNDTAACCVNSGTSVGNVATAVDGNDSTVDRGNNLNVLAVAIGDHSTRFVGGNGNLRSNTGGENNLNYLTAEAGGNGKASEVDVNLHVLKDDRACKSNICCKVYVVVCTKSSLKVCLVVNANGLVYNNLILVIASYTRSYRVKNLAICPIVRSTAKVTECINVIVNIFVTAEAGVGCVALIGTGGKSNRLYVSVSIFGNDGLCYDNLVTNATVRALGKTCLGTGRSLCRVGYGGVSVCGKDGLCYESLATNAAVLTLGKTCFGTGRSLCRVGYGGVSVCGKDGLCYESLATNATVLTLGKTGFGTGRSLRRVGYCGMTGSRYYGILIAVATRTGVSGITIILTGGSSYNCIVRVNVYLYAEAAVTVILTVEAICTVVGYVGGEATAGDFKSSLAVFIGLVTVYVAYEVTSSNECGTAYDTFVAGKVIIPVEYCKSGILIGCTVVYNVTTLYGKNTVNANGYLLIRGNGTLALNSKSLVDTNEYERIAGIVVISLCGRDCMTVKVENECTCDLAVVFGLNVNVFRSLGVSKKSDCITAYRCVKRLLKRFVLGFANHCYCNKCRNAVAIFGLAASVCTSVNGVACGIKGRSYNSTRHHIVVKSLDCLLALNVIATRTILICGVTVLGTGSSLAVHVNEVVVESRYKLLTAYGTGLCGSTGCCRTGIMAGCLDCLLALNVIATRTILVCGVTVLGAGSILADYVNELVIESVNSIIGLGFTTSTSIIGITACCTSGSNYLTCNPSMTGCGNFACADSLTTIITNNGSRTCYSTCSIFGCSGGVGVRAFGLAGSLCICCNAVCSNLSGSGKFNAIHRLNKRNSVYTTVFGICQACGIEHISPRSYIFIVVYITTIYYKRSHSGEGDDYSRTLVESSRIIIITNV